MFLDFSEFRKFDTYPAWKKKKYLNGFQKQNKKKQNSRTSRKINQELQEIEWLKKSEAMVADNDLEVKED